MAKCVKMAAYSINHISRKTLDPQMNPWGYWVWHTTLHILIFVWERLRDFSFESAVNANVRFLFHSVFYGIAIPLNNLTSKISYPLRNNIFTLKMNAICNFSLSTWKWNCIKQMPFVRTLACTLHTIHFVQSFERNT